MKKPLPIGPETRKKAAKTQSGRFAAALSRILYNADTKTSESGIRHLFTPAETFCGDDELPDGVPLKDPPHTYFDTEKLLRELRDHLEWLAFREVLP